MARRASDMLPQANPGLNPSTDVKDAAETKGQQELMASEALRMIQDAAVRFIPNFLNLGTADQRRAAATLAESMGYIGTAAHWRSLANEQQQDRKMAAEDTKRRGEQAAAASHQDLRTHNTNTNNANAFNAARAARRNSHPQTQTTAGLNTAGNPSTSAGNPFSSMFQTLSNGWNNFTGGMQQAFAAGARNAQPGSAEMGPKMAGITGVIDQVGQAILGFFKVLTGGDRITTLPDGTVQRTPQPMFPFIQYIVELGQKILSAFAFTALGAQELSGFFKSPGSDLTAKQKQIDHGGAYSDITKKLPEDLQKELFSNWDSDQSANHRDSWRHLRSVLEEQALVKPKLTPHLLPFVDSDERQALQDLQGKAKELQAKIDAAKPAVQRAQAQPAPVASNSGNATNMLANAAAVSAGPEMKGLQEGVQIGAQIEVLKRLEQELKTSADLEKTYRETASHAKQLSLSLSQSKAPLEFQRRVYEFRKEMHNAVTDQAHNAEQRLENLHALKNSMQTMLAAEGKQQHEKQAAEQAQAEKLRQAEFVKEKKLRQEAQQKYSAERKRGDELARRLSSLEQQFQAAANMFGLGGGYQGPGAGPYMPSNFASGNASGFGARPGVVEEDLDDASNNGASAGNSAKPPRSPRNS